MKQWKRWAWRLINGKGLASLACLSKIFDHVILFRVLIGWEFDSGLLLNETERPQKRLHRRGPNAPMSGGPFVFRRLRRDAPKVLHSFETLWDQASTEPGTLRQIPFFRTSGEELSLDTFCQRTHRAIGLDSLEYRPRQARVEHIVRQRKAYQQHSLGIQRFGGIEHEIPIDSTSRT